MTGRPAHIVVVDDDDDIRSSLTKYLRKHGLRVTAAASGTELNTILATASVDLLILDIMMPGEDGLAICRRVQEDRELPIIFLTALAEDVDRIVGLELGADDYVVKPFNPRELVARIKSALRRSQTIPTKASATQGCVRFDRWQFDFSRKELVDAENRVVRLSSGEHTLLVSLIEHAGTTLSRDQLIDLTKGREAQLFDRSIDNVISRLRHKIEIDPKNPTIVQTQWGSGYPFAAAIETVN